MNGSISEKGICPARVKRIDLIVVGAVDHTGTAAVPTLAPLCACKPRVRELVGPSPAAAVERLDAPSDELVVRRVEVDLVESVIPGGPAAAFGGDHRVGGAVG